MEEKKEEPTISKTETVEPTIPISEMFLFAEWIGKKEIIFIIDRWVNKSPTIGSNSTSDLWNKYQEYKQKVK